MLNLFRLSRKNPAPQEEPEVEAPPPPPALEPRDWSVGQGNRVYAIGDIHGRLDLFQLLLGKIAHHDSDARGVPQRLHIVLLGDLVDRGPDACGVIDLALKLRDSMPTFTCLMGNHEEVFLMALSDNMSALRFFKRIGGAETLLSYGIDQELIDSGDDEALYAEMLAVVPEAHRDFLADLPHSLVIGDYLFVHAGIKPGVALDEQTEADMHWIREEFLANDAYHPHMVVHGHSITEYVDEQPNRIGIDTGAYATDCLTAIGLEGQERWFLAT